MTFRRTSPHAGARWFVLLGTVVAMTVLIGTVVLAGHGLATLAGSNFEIDDNANLKLDHASPSVDWGSLAHTGTNPPELRRTDAPTGQSDDSYKGGVKEDTACPGETTGSIPNNKSDLLTFHVYEEPGDPGFLNIAWGRVSDPSGTTLMDFEFNQSTTPCAAGPNVERTAGDLLIEYAIDQGGARAEISGRFWTGTAWGPAVDLDDGTACGGSPCAVGTINNTAALPAAESDGLGDKALRTFGEAQIDLDLIFDDTKCTSFGSAMLKSRSSDSFTSQLKDFIRPIPITLTNCGKVIIHKETDPDGATASFGYTKAFSTDPSSTNTFSLSDGGTKTFTGVLFGTGYTVDETTIPGGWDFDSVDCSASVGVTPTIAGSLVTFDIDDEDDVLECTYHNKARAKLTVVKVANDGTLPADFDFTSSTLTPSSFTLTPTATGAAGADSLEFSNLVPGTYDVAETEPAGWNLVSATCDNGDGPASVTLAGGDDVTCTFVNEVERGAIEITKTRKHAADGAGDHAHAGVTFTITGGELPAAGTTVETNASGVACLDGLLYGDYTVTETVPAGYVSDDAEKDVSVSAESTCGDGNEAEVAFSNMPLTDITVSVDSQVDGGTASTIDCTPLDTEDDPDAETGATGDGSFDLSDLEPGTYTCVIVVDP